MTIHGEGRRSEGDDREREREELAPSMIAVMVVVVVEAWDHGDGTVGSVEVSLDGGGRWHPAVRLLDEGSKMKSRENPAEREDEEEQGRTQWIFTFGARVEDGVYDVLGMETLRTLHRLVQGNGQSLNTRSAGVVADAELYPGQTPSPLSESNDAMKERGDGWGGANRSDIMELLQSSLRVRAVDDSCNIGASVSVGTDGEQCHL